MAAAYTFDPVSNLTGTTVQIGEGQGQITLERAYAHDTANRLDELEAESGTFAFEYSAENGLVEYVANVDTGIGAAYAFDVMDRPTDIVWHDGQQGVIRSFAMTYARDQQQNELGTDMIEKIEHEDGTGRLYGYDSIDRLVSEQHFDANDTLLYSASYSYDLAGNRTSTTSRTPTPSRRPATRLRQGYVGQAAWQAGASTARTPSPTTAPATSPSESWPGSPRSISPGTSNTA